jgi:hypothetical protein
MIDADIANFLPDPYLLVGHSGPNTSPRLWPASQAIRQDRSKLATVAIADIARQSEFERHLIIEVLSFAASAN